MGSNIGTTVLKAPQLPIRNQHIQWSDNMYTTKYSRIYLGFFLKNRPIVFLKDEFYKYGAVRVGE